MVLLASGNGGEVEVGAGGLASQEGRAKPKPGVGQIKLQ